MSKKKIRIVEELEPENVTGIPEIHKQHYLSLGYKPYLMGDGRTKWLTDAQRVYKETKQLTGKPGKPGRMRTRNGMIRKRRSRHKFWRMIKENWLIIMIVVVVIVVLAYIFIYGLH
jgi:hypothetical protein